MEELTSALNNLTVLLIVIGGSLFTLCLAAGDPHKQQLDRGALLSSLIGVVILTMSPIAPRVLSRFVIEPSGGQALDRVGQASCDRTLRSSLITQRGVSTAARANSMIRQIQAQRRTECSAETWDPVVDDDQGCKTAVKAGDTAVPASLKASAGVDDDGITRDAEGNILVSFETASRPTDGSLCWLYVASADIWDQSATVEVSANLKRDPLKPKDGDPSKPDRSS